MTTAMRRIILTVEGMQKQMKGAIHNSSTKGTCS